MANMYYTRTHAYVYANTTRITHLSDQPTFAFIEDYHYYTHVKLCMYV